MKKYICLMLALVLCLSACSKELPSSKTGIFLGISDEEMPVLPDDNQDLPEKFDLRYDWKTPSGEQYNIISPVKDQSPFGTCWGHSIIAASEASLQAELVATGKINPNEFVDLSERQLAWFAYSCVPESEGAEDPAHMDGYYDSNGHWIGEGYHFTSEMGTERLNLGGFSCYGTNVFANGIGPIAESLAPYKNEENAICYIDDGYADNDSSIITLSSEQLQNMSSEDKATLMYYSDTLPNGDYATWALPDELRSISSFVLEDSAILPETKIYDEERDIERLDDNAINCIKSEIYAGRAVTVSYKADQSLPGETGTGFYIKYNDDGTVSHYTYTVESSTHNVTIIGWDDSYSKDKFVVNPDNGLGPATDGAWIVKNSWGSEESDFPNHSEWGTRNADGLTTGYFYLSYCDASVQAFETFDYDIRYYPYEPNSVVEFNSYTNLTTGIACAHSSEYLCATANIFVSQADFQLDSISYQSASEHAIVKYQVFLLDNGAQFPTDGQKVYEKLDYYRYAGFHRVFLNDDSEYPPIDLAKGQRYSVIVTEKSLLNNEYYFNTIEEVGFRDSLSDWEKDAIREEAEFEVKQRIYDEVEYDLIVSFWETDPYLSDDELSTKILQHFEKTWNDTLKNMYAQEIEDEFQKKCGNALREYSIAVINPGESFLYMEDEGWLDQSDILDVFKDTDENPDAVDLNMQIDNFPIRTYSAVKSAN